MIFSSVWLWDIVQVVKKNQGSIPSGAPGRQGCFPGGYTELSRQAAIKAYKYLCYRNMGRIQSNGSEGKENEAEIDFFLHVELRSLTSAERITFPESQSMLLSTTSTLHVYCGWQSSCCHFDFVRASSILMTHRVKGRGQIW